jgi:hypothetical protein
MSYVRFNAGGEISDLVCRRGLSRPPNGFLVMVDRCAPWGDTAIHHHSHGGPGGRLVRTARGRAGAGLPLMPHRHHPLAFRRTVDRFRARRRKMIRYPAREPQARHGRACQGWRSRGSGRGWAGTGAGAVVGVPGLRVGRGRAAVRRWCLGRNSVCGTRASAERRLRPRTVVPGDVRLAPTAGSGRGRGQNATGQNSVPSRSMPRIAS